jgi:hypothetical protein
VVFQSLGTNAEQRFLGLVAVRDDTALEPARRTGHIGQRLGNPAACARFGSNQARAALRKYRRDRRGKIVQLDVVAHAPLRRVVKPG